MGDEKRWTAFCGVGLSQDVTLRIEVRQVEGDERASVGGDRSHSSPDGGRRGRSALAHAARTNCFAPLLPRSLGLCPGRAVDICCASLTGMA